MVAQSPWESWGKVNERYNILTLETELRSELWSSLELDAINNKLKAEKDPSIRKELQREKMRILQFAKLMSKTNLWSLTEEQMRVRDKIVMWKGYDSMWKWDLLMLEKYGVWVSSLVLSHESEDEAVVTNDISDTSFSEWSKLKVNFWKNASLNKRMWAGDILPPSVLEITVIPNNSLENKKYTWWKDRSPRTGKLQLTPRIGYHDVDGYIPVYDGDSIMVIKTAGTDSTGGEDYKNAKNRELLRERQYEAHQSGKPWTDLPEDIEAWESDEIPKNQLNFTRKYYTVLNEECLKYNMPPALVIQLIKMESAFDPKNSPKEYGNPNTDAAYWFWQHIKTTWNDVNKKYFQWNLVRTNPEDQIRATCAYLNEMKTEKNCDWAMAMIYYHTWPNVDKADIAQYKKSNPFIAGFMSPWDNSLEWYKKAATKFYKVDQFASSGYTEIKPEDWEEIVGKTSPDRFITSWHSLLWTPYRIWWTGESWIDCSGFISKIMQETGVVKNWFRYNAAGLHWFVRPKDKNDIKTWDLMFIWWPHAVTGYPTYNHVAIVLWTEENWKVRILDASWPQSGDWKVSERIVSIGQNYSFWRPTFYS